jgi:hypothetical protein
MRRAKPLHQAGTDAVARQLIFDWTPPERVRRVSWLMFYLFITVLGLAVLFIIFRIVPPQPPKLTARPQQIIVLDPSAAEDRALIHRSLDRTFPLIPSVLGRDSLRQLDPEHLAKTPAYRPESRDFQFSLREGQSDAMRALQLPLITQARDLLPAPPADQEAPQSTAGAEAAVSQLQLRLSGEAAGALLSSPTLATLSLSDAARVHYLLCIGSRGQVELAMPLSSSENAAIMVQLHTAMTQLRFQAVEEEHRWVEASFAWQKTADMAAPDSVKPEAPSPTQRP